MVKNVSLTQRHRSETEFCAKLTRSHNLEKSVSVTQRHSSETEFCVKNRTLRPVLKSIASSEVESVELDRVGFMMQQQIRNF
jgi:hypothetical protein